MIFVSKWVRLCVSSSRRQRSTRGRKPRADFCIKKGAVFFEFNTLRFYMKRRNYKLELWGVFRLLFSLIISGVSASLVLESGRNLKIRYCPGQEQAKLIYSGSSDQSIRLFWKYWDVLGELEGNYCYYVHRRGFSLSCGETFKTSTLERHSCLEKQF